MLKPIVGPGEDRPPLVPDDLLVMHKSDPQQTIQNLAGESRSVPNISYSQTGNQREGLGPVGPRVRRYRRIAMPLGAFEIAGLGRPAAI